LIRIDANGGVVNDIASWIDISDNHLTYTVTLSTEARFQDGSPVTAEDVAFTISKVMDPLIKSPRRGNWEGVNVSTPDDHTIVFTLKRPYAPFIYNLTLGILPKHIWKNVSADEFSFSQFNTLPIGSGAYQIKRVERNNGGIPNLYQLQPFTNSLQNTYINNLVLKFYPSEDDLVEAYQNGDIESIAGLSPEKLKTLDTTNAKVIHSPLPRIFAVFFNQTHNKAIADKAVRQALDTLAPRREIIKEVFNGFATPISSPFPAGLYSWTSLDGYKTPEASLKEAREILTKGGWVANTQTGLLEKKSGKDTIPLSFSISTGDAPELKHVAEILQTAWKQLGADVQVVAFETGELNQSVIRPRNFDALLFGEMVGKDADLYPFWHSSQRSDPGLNISVYANSKADRLLEQARGTTDRDGLEAIHQSLSWEVRSDMPAVFLYIPSFIYILPNKVMNVGVGPLLSSTDRFANIRDWYIETDKVWEIFLNN